MRGSNEIQKRKTKSVATQARGRCMTEYRWRDIGDGKPIRVKVCPMCGVAPSNVDDCGEFGNPECPYFGIGLEEYEKLYEGPDTMLKELGK